MPATASTPQRKGSFSKQGASWADEPVTHEPLLNSAGSDNQASKTETETSKAQPFGPSILKEIFPDHGKLPEEVVNRIPSPSRARRPSNPVMSPITKPNSRPQLSPSKGAGSPSVMSTSPVHAPGPVGPLAPMLPVPPMQMQQQWDAQQMAGMQQGPDASYAGGSYRERLRAGGRGAFQRTMDAGFVPRTYKQDQWNGSAYGEGFMEQQMQGMGMEYGMGADAQLMWNGSEQMAGNDYWGTPVNQFQQEQYGFNMSPQGSDYYTQPMAQQQDPFMMGMMSSPQGDGQTLLQTSPVTSQHGGAQLVPMPPLDAAGALATAPPLPMMPVVGGEQDKDLLELQMKAAAELENVYED